MTRKANRGEIPSDLGWLVDELDETRAALRALQAPTGTQNNRVLENLRALIDDIQSQLDAYNASRYTNEQIDDLIDTKVAAYVASILAGNVSIGGALSVAGDVNMPGVRSRNILAVSDRVVVWVGGGGEMGNTA